MQRAKLLIIDHDVNNLRLLENHFKEANYHVVPVQTERDASHTLEQNAYDLILTELSAPGIDGYRILETIQRQQGDTAPPVVFLTPKSDVWHRVKSFKLGVKDYIVKPRHVREIVGRVDMVRNRLTKRHYDECVARKKFIGRLEDLSLTELIETFGVEQKSGILGLYNENGVSGKIYFREGVVIDAVHKQMRPENAIYKMMSWQRGRFSMWFCDVDGEDRIGVSNMGLLLQGAKRMDQREELLQLLPSLDAVLVTTQNFKRIVESQELEPDLDRFIRLFDGERTLGRVIDESLYDELTTLKRLHKLYELGFIYVISDLQPTPSSRSSEATSSEHTGQTGRSFDKPVLDRSDTGETGPKQPAPPKPVNDKATAPPDRRQESGEDSPSAPSESEEADPFSIFRKAAETSESFGFDQWDATQFPDLQSDESMVGGQEHPADELFKVRGEESTPSKETEELVPQTTPQPSSDASRDDLKQKFRRARGHVLVFGHDSDAWRHWIDATVQGSTREEQARQEDLSHLYYGTAEFRGGHLLNIVGIPLGKEFTPYIDVFSRSTLGYMIFIDLEHVDWNYQTYLSHVLADKLDTPATLVLYGDEYQLDKLTDEELAMQLGYETPPRISRVPAIDSKTARQHLFSLFEVYYKKRKQQNPAETRV
jgi:CheY-like chemotaxis protein